jgi:hypothetical protein
LYKIGEYSHLLFSLGLVFLERGSVFKGIKSRRRDQISLETFLAVRLKVLFSKKRWRCQGVVRLSFP